MAKFSIMLFGFDSYTKSRMWLPYKLEAEKADAAVREGVRGQGEPTRNL